MIALDRPMPKNCRKCPLYDLLTRRCVPMEVYFGEEDTDIFISRMPDCPLIDLSKYEDDCK